MTTTTWSCPRCTLENDLDATTCTICEELRPVADNASHGKGRGRLLRSRASDTTEITVSVPPVTEEGSSNPEVEEEGDDDDDDDDDEDEDFVISLNSKSKSKSRRNPRATAVGRKGKAGRGNSGSGTSKNVGIVNKRRDSGLRFVGNGDGVGTTPGTVIDEATTTRSSTSPPNSLDSGAAQQPLQLDIDTSDDQANGNNCVSVDEDSSAGEEAPVLFGRGWGDKRHPSFDAAASSTATKKSGVATGSSSSAVARRRGKKRQRPRPLPPTPSLISDDIFRTGIHAYGGDSGSDGEGRPLAPPPRRARTFGGTLSGGRLWRWPPCPSISVTAKASSTPAPAAKALYKKDADNSSSARPSNGASGQHSDSGLDVSVREPTSGATDEETAETGDSDDKEEASSPAGLALESESSGKALQESMMVCLPSQPQERKPPRKRSKLSLPKRKSVESCQAPTEPEERSFLKSQSADVPVPDGSGDADIGTSTQDGGRVGMAAETICLAGLRADSSIADEDRVEVLSGTKGTGDSNVGCREDGGMRSTRGGESKDLSKVVPRDDETETDKPPSSAAQAPAENPQVTRNVCSKDPSTIVAAAAHAGGDAGSAAIAVRLPVKRTMVMEMDDDSDSSEDSETQATPDNGAAHLGQAMDEECDHATSGTSGRARAAAPPTSLLTTASEAPSERQIKNDVDRSKAPGEDVILSAPQTPRREMSNAQHHVNTRTKGKDSPDASSMGLVDTPPRFTEATSGRKKGSAAKKTPRRSATPLGGFAHSLSPSTPPPTRGKWACAMCTFENMARAKTCKLCNASKPALAATDTGAAGVKGVSLPDRNAARLKSADDQCIDIKCGGADRMQSGGVPEERGGNAVTAKQEAPESGVDAKAENDELDKLEGGATASLKRSNVVLDPKHGFVGDVGAILSEEEMYSDYDYYEDGPLDDDDDEEWREDGDNDNDGDETEREGEQDPEYVGSQIEERWSKVIQKEKDAESSAQRSPSRKRQRQEPPAGEVFDLTEAAENTPEKRNGSGNGYLDSNGHRRDAFGNSGDFIEDISEDDADFSTNPRGITRGYAGGDEAVEYDGGRRGDDAGFVYAPKRKYRFFTTVEEHRENASSCVNFEALLPESGASRAKSYGVRRQARDAKEKKGKRGRKAKRDNGVASKRGKGRARVGSVTNLSSPSSRSSNRAASTGSGGVPSSAWIPDGIGDSTRTSTAVGERKGAAAAKGGAARQPFNHYQRSDDVVEDSGGAGGGVHWEHAGRSTFGD